MQIRAERVYRKQALCPLDKYARLHHNVRSIRARMRFFPASANNICSIIQGRLPSHGIPFSATRRCESHSVTRSQAFPGEFII